MFEDFYGLHAKPFQLTPDPAFYFPSGTHRKALSYLQYGLAQSEGFIVITGEVGAGKSTLVAHLVSSVSPEELTIGQIVTSKLDEDEIIHVVARSFGLDIDGHDKASALAAIEGFLHSEAREGRRCLLVMDESQNLSVDALEELRMLSNFQLGSHPLLQTLLLGQPEFRDTLQNSNALEQLRQRVIATHHLDPMEAEEIEPYIKHRLAHVGWQGNPAWDQRVFTELAKATGGVPRKINQLANRLMLLGAVEQRSRIDAAMLKAVLDEMSEDNAFPAAAPKPMPKPGPAPEPIKVQRRSLGRRREDASLADLAAKAVDPDEVVALIKDRDDKIAELQQAVIELSDELSSIQAAKGSSGDGEDLNDRFAALEAKLSEQEAAMRHTLIMLIEWVEGETGASMAA
ncbi:XrtA/PEP-CTERM system-associated ATPase [Altererythrobacter sp. CAU 1778]